MKKSDFKKGQTVYLLVIEGSNEYRYRNSFYSESFENRIKEAVVVSVGTRYITTKPANSPYEIKFDIQNNFRQSIDAGSYDYYLFLNKQDAFDYQEKRDLVKEIRNAFNDSLWFNTSKYTLGQLRRVKEILEETK